jgi:hypothetical protein
MMIVTNESNGGDAMHGLEAIQAKNGPKLSTPRRTGDIQFLMDFLRRTGGGAHHPLEEGLAGPRAYRAR